MDVNKSILIIEDEDDISELVAFNLGREGFETTAIADGSEGLAFAIANRPRLVLLDLMLPGMSGLEVCKRLRAHSATAQIPIIMLTAKSEESDIIVGLELGADDYMTKPFSPRELVARVRSVLRRASDTAVEQIQEKIEIGPVSIDVARHEVLLGGKDLALTLAEFKLLKMLTSKPGRVFTRDQLLDSITGSETFVIDRNVDVHVRAIRKKLGDHAGLIQTIRGVGYKWRD